MRGWVPIALLCPQVLQDCQRYRSNIREVGDLWVSRQEEQRSVPCWRWGFLGEGLWVGC